MKNNLSYYKSKINGIEIEHLNNKININIEVGVADPMDIYISLHSYVQNPEIAIKKIELTHNKSYIIRNIRALMRFRYIEFKL
jgi:hypothetical protein